MKKKLLVFSLGVIVGALLVYLDTSSILNIFDSLVKIDLLGLLICQGPCELFYGPLHLITLPLSLGVYFVIIYSVINYFRRKV